LDIARTAGRMVAGGLAAVVLGTSAGAALRPAPVELREPAAPQQIYAPEAALSAMERQGGGWPAHSPG
jgi:hypothetical protein